VKLADIELNRVDDLMLARVVGEVDLSNAAELRRALAGFVANDARGMVLDLSVVDYVDAAGTVDEALAAMRDP
jgi:anti-anti-sigma factor